MTSQSRQQIITIHIFPNISRSKSNQAMKMGQLIEYKSRVFVFIVCPSWGLAKYVKQRYWPVTYALYKAFIKNKKRFLTSLPTIFSAWFLKKHISRVIFY